MINACAGRIIDRKKTPREYDYKAKLVYQKVAGVKYVVKLKDLINHEDKFGKLNNLSCPKVCNMDRLFDALFEAHVATGHAAVYRTHKNVCTKFSNISLSIAEMFFGLCPICSTTRLITSRKAECQPILSKPFNDRAQIDLIDMQSSPDGTFNWILHYQDHLTKFSCLRPLRKKVRRIIIINISSVH